MTKLNNEQCRLIEKNSNLIYEYMILNELDFDEWYGICAIGICFAAKIFDESKGKFSTIAFKCMANEVCNERRKCGSILNEELSDNISLFKMYTTEDDLIFKMFIEDYKSKLNETYNTVFNMMILGYTQKEISNKCLINQSSVSRIINKIRSDIHSYIYQFFRPGDLIIRKKS